MKILNFIAIILLIICGLNAGVIGVFNTSIIAMFLNSVMLTKVANIAFGVSAVIVIYDSLKRKCK